MKNRVVPHTPILSVIILTVVILVTLCQPTVFAKDKIDVTINGQIIEFDQDPIAEEGRTLVPMRTIFESLNAIVNWDADTQTVTAKKNSTEIKLTLGSNIAEINGEKYELDVPAKAVNNRTLVPARFVAEALKCDVKWNSDTNTVIIKNGKQIIYSDNLFDIDKATHGYYMAPVGTTGKNPVYAYSDYMKVTPGETIYFTHYGLPCEIGFIAAYDANKNVVKESGASYVKEYTVPENIEYIVISVNEKFTAELRASNSNKPDWTVVPEEVSLISSEFDCSSETEDYIPVTAYTSTNTKTDWIYGLYDQLVAKYPDYVTRTEIARTAEPVECYNSNGEKRTDLKSGIPMYRYDFNLSAEKGNSEETPKILYISGIHGGEYYQVIAGYRFFNMLCEKWDEFEILEQLREGVHFVVVPLANPFGFEYPSGRYNSEGLNVSKLNERNVDISGNFPADDFLSKNSSGDAIYGDTPLSEPESQAIYDIINSENFILGIDNHTYNFLASDLNTRKMAGYFINNQYVENSIAFWSKIGRWLNIHVREMSPEIDDSYDIYDMAPLWLDKRQQMLSNTFKCVSANVESSLGIHPTDKNLLKEESQAYLVNELTVIFYEAMLDFGCN